MEEARGFVVLRVERQPRDICAARIQPVEPRERKRCLAETGGRLDDCEPFVFRFPGKRDEPRPIDQSGRQARRKDLRCEEERQPVRGRCFRRPVEQAYRRFLVVRIERIAQEISLHQAAAARIDHYVQYIGSDVDLLRSNRFVSSGGRYDRRGCGVGRHRRTRRLGYVGVFKLDLSRLGRGGNGSSRNGCCCRSRDCGFCCVILLPRLPDKKTDEQQSEKQERSRIGHGGFS